MVVTDSAVVTGVAVMVVGDTDAGMVAAMEEEAFEGAVAEEDEVTRARHLERKMFK